ncbi:MAG: 50S ribosomal protein L19e [Candidatus Micrarchaeaceae archaeon]
MSIKLTKRIASSIMHRGVSAIKIAAGSEKNASEAITRSDVKELIKSNKIYAVKAKKNISRYGKELNKKREQGRRRGKGSKKGTKKTRLGFKYIKEIRAQRRILSSLKAEKIIDNEAYKRFYALSKGGSFPTKLSLINHIRSKGFKISDEQAEALRHK